MFNMKFKYFLLVVFKNLKRKLLLYWLLFNNSRIFISSPTFIYFSVYC